MGKIISHAFSNFTFQNYYFSYQIESIWIIIALVFNLGKIFPVVGIDDGMKSVGFSGLLDCVYSGLSIVICHCLGTVLHPIVTRTQQTTFFSEMFISVHHILKMLMADKTCHRVLQPLLPVTGFFSSNINKVSFEVVAFR